jgi:hypothetical protein
VLQQFIPRQPPCHHHVDRARAAGLHHLPAARAAEIVNPHGTPKKAA